MFGGPADQSAAAAKAKRRDLTYARISQLIEHEVDNNAGDADIGP